jgi:hypothetical protein
VQVDHLHGGKLLQHAARGQSGRQRMQAPRKRLLCASVTFRSAVYFPTPLARMLAAAWQPPAYLVVHEVDVIGAGVAGKMV